jgi:hypothetical protein
MSAANNYVAQLFLARDLAHRAHLGTSSYAQHVALNEFYLGIVDHADAFAEAYQGQYNELLDIPLLDSEYEGEIADVLEQVMAWIEDNREQICPRELSSLHNLIDAAVELFQRTLYKLRYLN